MIGLLLAALEEAGFLCAFDREVVYLKHACEAELGKIKRGPALVANPPYPGEFPEQEMPAGYAVRILAAIERVRAYRDAGDSRALAEALIVGELAAELDAQYDSRAAKALRGVRLGGSHGAREAQKTKQDEAEGLLRNVDGLLANDPNLSDIDIARELLPLYRDEINLRDNVKGNEDARYLKALAARIRRARSKRPLDG